MNGHSDLQERLSLYQQFDEARQQETSSLVNEFMKMKSLLETVQGDLEDEKMTRRAYKKRAEDAEAANLRHQFALVLIDGDGYIFNHEFLMAAQEGGGAAASSRLFTMVKEYLKNSGIVDMNEDLEIMVNVYANKQGLARTLYNANVLQSVGDLDQFFWSFTQSRSLFQFIDCGPGKERADTKLRDTFRFYVHNPQCRHVFLACCHDTGYIAEFTKYSHDPVVRPKTSLVRASASPQASRAYSALPFDMLKLDTVFDMFPVDTELRQRKIAVAPVINGSDSMQGATSMDRTTENLPIITKTTYSSVASNPRKTSTSPILAQTNTISSPIPEAQVATPVKASEQYSDFKHPAKAKTEIPVNRVGQRVDLRMRTPTSAAMEKFEARIKTRKLCNEHHLRDNCYQYNCWYDHDPIDPEMENTLRFKARSIPCPLGTKCRRLDCYLGHFCPWASTCTPSKCPFSKSNLHDITDTEVFKYVPPETWKETNTYL